MLRVAHLRFTWRLARRILRLVQFALVALLFAFAATVLVLRYYVLPQVDRFRDPIAAAAGRAIGVPIAIGAIAGSWSGPHPRLTLRGVTLHDRQNRPALELEEVEAVISWHSLLAAGVRMRSLVIVRPDLVVRRDAAGALFVAGVPVRLDGPDSGFADWLLAQSKVQVRDARLTWIDEQRGAPPLELRDVLLHLENQRRQHRFALRAKPPAELGTQMDLRGDFRTGRTGGMRNWRGRVYLHAPYTNLGAVRAWADLPLVLESGAGDVEGWLEFSGATVQSATVDLRVAGAVARLDPALEPLDVPELQGRLTWYRTPDGFEATARRLTIGVGGGAFLPSSDVVIRVQREAARLRRLQVESDRLDLAPIVYFLRRLPVPAALQEALVRHQPTGRVTGLSFWMEPAAGAAPRFHLATRFEDVSIRGDGSVPGLQHVSGNVRAEREAGWLELDSRGFRLEAPRLFEAAIAIDRLTGKAEWRTDPNGLALTLQDVAFENPDLAGRLQGGLRFPGGGAAAVSDLTAQLARGAVPAVHRYLPVMLAPELRTWLRTALVAGQAAGASMVLRGPLDRFPFAGDEGGQFQVRIPATSVDFRFAPDWPPLTQADVAVVLHGAALEIDGRSRILGASVTAARAVVPDLWHADPRLEVSGDAHGSLQEFLRFVEDSPLGAMAGHVARGVKGEGDGQLKLSFVLPLARMHDVRVAGRFQFSGNRVEGLVDLPPLQRLTGALEFSEKGAHLPGATAEFLGMPVRFGVDVRNDGSVVVEARGRARAEGLRDRFPHPMLGRLAGETDWRALASVRGARGELTVESDLKGLAVNLPRPLGKAADETVPARYQRRWRDGELLQSVNVAERIAAITAGADDDPPEQFRRGAIDIGGGVARLPERPGLVITGNTPRLGVDEWLAVADAFGRDGATAAALPITVDFKVGVLDVAERQIHDLALRIQRKGSLWDGSIASREIQGRLDWMPTGRGRLVARLDRLHLPETDVAPGGPVPKALEGQELPALDITADSFRYGPLDLGALVLRAAPDGASWQIEKLDCANPDGHLTAQGGWQNLRGKSRTQLAVRVEARDIGRFLKRMNRPEGVSGGTATLAGVVEWDGTPQKLDVATLSGRLSLEAHRGQFTKLEPGIGKLFGILSLQALPRRISLDFRDVFSQGFAFEEITGNSTITRGVLHTTDLKMTGSSARVTMSGDIDLAHESQNLEVKVAPSVSDSLAIGAAIVNPLAGLATLLLGKALDNPIDRAIAFEYKVTGTWADPVVAKSGRQPTGPAARPR